MRGIRDPIRKVGRLRSDTPAAIQPMASESRKDWAMTDDPVDALLWAVIVTVLLFMVFA